MLRLESIVGLATDAALAERLHHLEHDGKVEYILLAGEDTARRRLHVATDRGTDCAIVLPRSDRLANGAVLLLEHDRAIVVRLKDEAWLSLVPRDGAAALEIALHGSVQGDTQRRPVETHWPMHVAGEIAELERGGAIARDERQPRLFLQAYNDGAVMLQQQYGAVCQTVAARQHNRAIGAAVGRDMQAPTRRVLAGEQDVFHLAIMLEVMQPFGERRIGRQSDD